MSGRAYQPLEYEATLCPTLVPVEVMDAKHGLINELFGLHAFNHAERDPASVPVVHRHGDDSVEVGHLVAIDRGARWLRGTFWLYDDLVGIYAAEQLEHGSPVSVEYTPNSTLNRVGLLDCHWHIEAHLDALAIGIDRSAYDELDGGAKITAIRTRPRPSRAKQNTTAVEPDDEDHARRAELAKRNVLVRRCGTIISIR